MTYDSAMTSNQSANASVVWPPRKVVKFPVTATRRSGAAQAQAVVVLDRAERRNSPRGRQERLHEKEGNLGIGAIDQPHKQV